MPGFVHQIPQPDWLTHVKFGRRGLVFVPWTDTGTGRRVYGILKNSGGEVTLSIVVRDLDAGDNPLYVDTKFWIGENNKVLTVIGGDSNPTLATDETYICENSSIVAKFSGVPVGRPRCLLSAALFKGNASEGSVQHYVVLGLDMGADPNKALVLYGVAKSQAKDVYAWYEISNDFHTLNWRNYPGVFSPNGRSFIVESSLRNSENIVEYVLRFDTSSNRIIVEGKSVLARKTITEKANYNVVTTYHSVTGEVTSYEEIRTSSVNGDAYASIGYTRDNQISAITKTYTETQNYSHTIYRDIRPGLPHSYINRDETETTTILRDNIYNYTFLNTNPPSTLNKTYTHLNLNRYVPFTNYDVGISSEMVQQFRTDQETSTDILLLNSIYPFSFYVIYADTSGGSAKGNFTYNFGTPNDPECSPHLTDSDASMTDVTDEAAHRIIVCGQELESLTFRNVLVQGSSCVAHCEDYPPLEGCPQSWCDPEKEDADDDPVGDCYRLGYGRGYTFSNMTFDQSSSTETTKDYYEVTGKAASAMNYRNDTTFSLTVPTSQIDVSIFYGDGVFVYQKIKKEKYFDEQNIAKWRLIEQKATAYTFSAAGIETSVDLLAMFNEVYQAKIDAGNPEFISLPPYSEDELAINKFPFTNIGIM